MSSPDFAAILSDSSRSLADYTAAMVGSDEKMFRQLMDLAYTQKSPVSMRAARVADFCCERYPELIRPYLTDMVKNLPGLRDMSVKRVFMHILIRHSWVEDDEAMGKLVDTLLKWLMDDSQDISIKAYAMVILENITRLLPDLRYEMIAVIEEAMPYWSSAALRHSGKKVLKNIRKGKSVDDAWA